MRAHIGPDLRCPVCARPQHGVSIRSGDAWVTCWHRQCNAILWVAIVPAHQPTAADVAALVGDRLAASLLATYPPAPVIALEVPAHVAPALRLASRLALLSRLTAVLVGEQAIKPALPPLTREAA
jgi:hypothetical protein